MPSQLPVGFTALSARLNQIGFERTRRALAALALSVFVSIYLLVSLGAPEGFARVFVALALCYGVAFVGVVAEFFWARWFATGLAWSGVMIAIIALVQLGWTPQFGIFGGLHLLVIIALMGKKMAARYDLQEAWRARYKIDDFGVARLQKTVTRAAATLPSMIIWALAPKEEGLAALGALAALALVAGGLRGLIRLRSWGVLALAGAGALVAGFGHLTAFTTHGVAGAMPLTSTFAAAGPTLALLLLAAAVLPFAGAIVRYLRRPA